MTAPRRPAMDGVMGVPSTTLDLGGRSAHGRRDRCELGLACRAGLVVLALLLAAPQPSAAGEARPPVRSLLEIRQSQVVVQKFDISCGAAALATILRYQHGDMVEEREVALGLIDRPEYLERPELVRMRQGFSLLDLKRYVDRRGYEGIGFGRMDLDDLVAKAPVIVPVSVNEYNHFVVFRGRLGNRVLLADPAFGNVTMTVEAFERAWIDYGDIGKVGFVVQRRDGPAPPGRLAARPEEFVFLR
ncbi:MAG: C39 family peptidase [Geminicoccaceae bacterium]|nr:C39 family peptidase [Geminicoccaceae bacterium]MDW8371178.1 C39 family peptidase [Geminicoccaceae bacterium]